MNVIQTRIAPLLLHGDVQEAGHHERRTDPNGAHPPSHLFSVKIEFNSFYDSELLTVKGKVRIKCERLVYCFDEKYSCE